MIPAVHPLRTLPMSCAYQSIDPTQALSLSQGSEHSFIDVRTVEEFEAAHVQGSYNIPLLFRGPVGAQPNLDFVDVVKQRFALDASLVFV